MGLEFIISGLLPAGLLVLAAWLIKHKKMYWLISGYNTMSKDKKKKVDVEGLGKHIANMCFVMAGIIFLGAFFLVNKEMIFFGITYAGFLPVIIYTLVAAQKYDGNTKDAKGKMKKGTKIVLGIIIAILMIGSIWITLMLYNSTLPAGYSIDGEILRISGVYGQEVDINEIQNISLKQDIPEVIKKTNGSAINGMLKGNFELEEIGKATLFVDLSKSPYLFIETTSQKIIINLDDSHMTKALYDELYAQWEK